MSTGGMPELDRLLEEENEEDENEAQGGLPEDDGREQSDNGEEDGQEGGDDEGQEFAEEAELSRSDVGGSRRANRIRNLNRRLQESNRKNEELERRMAALEQGGGRHQPRQQEQESPEQEQARMALMTPEERMQYTLDRGMRSMNAMMAQAQAAQIETTDRTNFEALKATDRLARRFAPQVEQLFNQLKSQGRMTAREVILDYVIGQAARKANSSGKGSQKRRAAEREINRNRPSASTGRSDVSGERRRGAQTLEQRLEGKLI